MIQLLSFLDFKKLTVGKVRTYGVLLLAGIAFLSLLSNCYPTDIASRAFYLAGLDSVSSGLNDGTSVPILQPGATISPEGWSVGSILTWMIGICALAGVTNGNDGTISSADHVIRRLLSKFSPLAMMLIVWIFQVQDSPGLSLELITSLTVSLLVAGASGTLILKKRFGDGGPSWWTVFLPLFALPAYILVFLFSLIERILGYR